MGPCPLLNSGSTPTDIHLCHVNDQPTNFNGLLAGGQDPQDTAKRPRSGPRSSANEARELVARCSILREGICTVLEESSDNGENQRELEGGALADEAGARRQIMAPPLVSEESPRISGRT